MFYQKEPTERQVKLYKLRNKAQIDEAALQLFHVIELECGTLILDNPNKAPESMVRRYNELVRGSNLPFSERQQLLMAKKEK